MALYHSARGDVGYTIEGSPTIVDGVISGITSSDVVKTSQVFPSSFNEIDMVFKVSEVTPLNGMSVCCWGSRNDRIRIYANSGTIALRDGNNNLITEIPSSAFSYNTYAPTGFYVGLKVTKRENDFLYTLSASADKNTWVSSQGTSTDDLCGEQVTWFLTSISGTYNGKPKMDLKETYIKVNGQPWFGICHVEVKKHQIMGPVGHTVVGSPTITDGVVSGISNGQNYIKISEVLPSVINSFEMVVKGKVGTGGSRSATCYSYKSGYYTYAGFYINYVTKDTTSAQAIWRYKPKPTSSSEDTAIFVPTGTTLLTNSSDWYWIKCTMQPAQENKFLYSFYDSLDGQNWHLLGSNEEAYQITGDDMDKLTFCYNPNNSTGNTAVTVSQIDTNQTYVKVNGKLWFWQPQATKYIQRNNQLVWSDPKLYLTGPVNYTVVGTPAIVDGVASGLANRTNYLSLSQQLPSTINSFEMVVRCDLGSSGRGSFAYSYPSGYYAYAGFYARVVLKSVTSTNAMWRYKAKQTSSETDHVLDVPTGTCISDSTTVLVYNKLSMETVGENDYLYSMYQSLDGQNWTLLASKHDTYRMNGNDIGFITLTNNPNDSSGNTSFYVRTIDLNETYIKVNDQLWFYGKNYATQNIAPVPAGYTYGNTTTSAIGYVDMRTQQFTPAPEGATIGRDE